ncbi:3-hydroxyisobutyrate dehydrogenase [Actinokineospora alba]|uniref:3-hydroxyisobutyrate dehydrogenase n=1 Tax=Actinokineospora alba TaxID=504798 RepID=A0A1H0QUY1_9PSEU|nr:NAD(P)-binding domain-containing protein [Actinokineospora alba]TDP70404.1 3-hydroxyisobutyrate dehydrogenase-like beta-hydroxyacid dehydrogenase [Actinokineospora alba]SDI32450.1 3-hydroxyisobutyrate dehydrogenase [Actinokineospora alba]SDP20538.1 3-hydroxyisobutyrate dehydrogenase [Actinokineospora alba]
MEINKRIAVVGVGAIGAAVARGLLADGHDVVVWNRTPERAAALAEAGARVAGSLTDAVLAGELVLLTLTDHDAVGQCLDAIDVDLSGRTVVTMCTGTADEAERTAKRVTALGADYLDAGIQASPDMIGTGTATILYSGSRSAFDRYREVLGSLSTPRFAGEEPGAAAVWDLALFGVWYDAQLGLLRALDVVRAAGVDVAEFAATAGPQIGHVVAGVPATVAELRDGEYPAGPATLTEHLTLLRKLGGQRAGTRLGDGGLAEVGTRISALVDAGRGGEGLTATIG